MKKRISLFTIAFLLSAGVSFSQSAKIDSLKTRLSQNLHDTERVKTLVKLSIYVEKTNLDTAFMIANQALAIIKKCKVDEINLKKFTASVYAKLGNNYFLKGDFSNALKYFKDQKKLNEEILKVQPQRADVAKSNAMCISNIGNVFYRQADYPNALDYYFRSLKYLEESNDKSATSSCFMNIGIVYSILEDYPKALHYYFKAEKIAEELGRKKTLMLTKSNIGSIYNSMQNYPKALDYLSSSLKIAEEMGDKQSMGSALYNIGSTYDAMEEYAKALDHYSRSLKLAEEMGDQMSAAFNLSNIGTAYTDLKKYKEAEVYLLRALALDSALGAFERTKDDEKNLSDLYVITNRPGLALSHYKKYIVARDSINNDEAQKKMARTEINYEYEKKEVKAKAEQEKKDAIANEEKQKQKIILWSVLGGLLLVIVFAIVMVQRFRVTQQQKKVIEAQKKITDEQKHQIEEKHKEITDSINYAERIQRSFLATKELLDENLNDYFVLFQPKDVVSGDFYWASKMHNDQFILATADSTGHGVPGAIMSLLNITSLEKAIEQHIEPALILNATRKTIIERLKKDGSPDGGKDGMDCSLISLDFKNNMLTYAAANNPVWIVRGQELLEFSPDKMPVGKHDKDGTAFTQHTITLQKNDVVYTLTDGLPDQFGGPKGKKFMYKRLKELLISITHLPMVEQKEQLAMALNEWKGDLEQVDDVCVIGVRI
ncbi:MAG: tetratricopeptide repeat protein [Bacteroidia bacterium]|nr:tetratricopeptide repeat protein [Bacteroidia bacterium]